jgi:squalene synthase HpnC
MLTNKSYKDSLTNSSFKYCEYLAKTHYENFPVASFLFPADKRKYIYSVYAFARAADDFADEDFIEGGIPKRLALLDEWLGKLKDCYNGKAYDPIFIALRETVNKFNIPIDDFKNLLTAFKQDVMKNRYKTFDEVIDYCTYSANPVGRIVLRISGHDNDELFHYSDKICTALQLINFWQDIEIDLKKDRVYLPDEDLNKFSYTYEDLFNKVYDERFVKLMDFQISRTEEIFKKGKNIFDVFNQNNLKKGFILEIKAIYTAGSLMLNKLRKVKYNVFKKRPLLNLNDRLLILYKTLFSSI